MQSFGGVAPKGAGTQGPGSSLSVPIPVVPWGVPGVSPILESRPRSYDPQRLRGFGPDLARFVAPYVRSRCEVYSMSGVKSVGTSVSTTR